ncbi:hypothetical protein VTK73DRAFT_9249 [Phialemonium thermophilum]|uniref:DUF6594 domain-containing protein n=1 Tax=Phialemonium thermophilum TaxID=223376 RepID=A0ABR3XLJ1_9PEZI
MASRTTKMDQIPDLEMQAPRTEEEDQDASDSGDETDWIHENDTLPLGWPQFAGRRTYTRNLAYVRRFTYLFQRTIDYYGARLGCLEENLREREAQEYSQGGAKAAQLRSLLPGQKRPLGEELIDKDGKEYFFENLGPLLLNFGQFLFYEAKLSKLPRMSRAEHSNMYRSVKENGMLDEEARRHLKYQDEFISTRTDHIDAPINWIYERWSQGIVDFLGKCFRPWAENRKISTSSDDTIPMRFIRGITWYSGLGFCGVTLLLPPSIIYLLEPSKPVSISIVAGSFVLVAVVFSRVRGMKTETIFFLLTGYLAVMVNFLASLH